MKIIKIVKHSINNINKHRKRSIISALSIFLCMTFLLLLLGISRGYLQIIVDNYVKTEAGSIQIHKMSYYTSVDDNDNKFFKLEDIEKIKNIQDILYFTGRLKIQASFSDGKNQTSVLVIGENIINENKILPERKNFIVNENLNKISLNDSVIISDKIGNSLLSMYNKNEVYNKNYSLSTTSSNGRENILDFQIASFLKNSLNFYSVNQTIISLLKAQELSGNEGLINEVVLSTKNPLDTQNTENKIRGVIGDSFDVRNWKETNSFLKTSLFYIQFSFNVISVIVLIMCILFTKNITLSNFNERQQEIGLMIALGIAKKTVILLFLFESFLISIMAGICGVFFSLVCEKYINYLKIQFPSIFEKGGDYLLVLIDYKIILMVFLSTIIIAVLSGVYPAIKLLKFQPIDALKED